MGHTVLLLPYHHMGSGDKSPARGLGARSPHYKSVGDTFSYKTDCFAFEAVRFLYHLKQPDSFVIWLNSFSTRRTSSSALTNASTISGSKCLPEPSVMIFIASSKVNGFL